jgi:hypothetical protein
MSMPILPNVPVQPSLRIGIEPCPTNMPPPAPTAVPLGERSVNVVVRAPVPAPPAVPAVPTAARTLTVQPLRTTPPDIKPAIVLTDDNKPAFRVGDYVRVKGDTSPDHNRPDGYAFIKQVRGHGAATLSSIQMVEVYGGSLFHDVRMQCMTPATFLGSELAGAPKRKRMASTVAPSPIPKKKTNNRKMPVEILVERLQHGSRYRLKKGWYCAQERSKRAAAGREGENGKKRLSRTEQQQLLIEVLLLESYNKSKPEVVQGHGQRGVFLKTSATSKGATLAYLVSTAWGRANNYLYRLKKKAMAEDGSVSTVLPATPNKSDSTNDEQFAVITSRELAKSIYTPKFLFALDQCRHEKNRNLDLQSTKQGYQERHAIALDKYDHLTPDRRKRWEMEARGHDEEQPLIKSRITEMLKRDPKISWESLELGIDRWCSASTIRRWVTSFDGFEPKGRKWQQECKENL